MPASPFILNRQPGVHFAFTMEGVELPVIDVTHPAFAVTVTEAEQRAQVEQFLKEQVPLSKLPAVVRRMLLRVFLRGSLLAQGIQGSQGTFLSGMSTYLLKLGPEWFARPIDQKIASALPGIGVRIRMQDMATLMAEALIPRLEAAPGRALRFLNIGGGPALDSLNALLILKRDRPDLLAGRSIAVQALDQDIHGPMFGARALEALRAPGGPLNDLTILFQRAQYDWSRTADLELVLQELAATGAIGMVSSEGALFEYGSDAEIVANLSAIRAALPDALVVGSVTRNDEAIRVLRLTSTALTVPRGLEAFSVLAHQAGWRVVRSIERVFSDHVLLSA